VERTAECPCGQLSITVEGDPIVVVACNCTNCQKKSGSVFNVVSTFKNEQVQSAKGDFNTFELAGDSGRKGRINFCPNCGTSVYWSTEVYSDECTSIAVGCFADPTFPAPTVSLWNKSRHNWVAFPEDMPCLETQLTEEQVQARLSEQENA
jgi:hypothetical protein